MISKGHPPKGLFPADFFDKLTIFNERIQAFNHLLVIQGINYAVSRAKNAEKDEFAKKAEHINNVIHNYLIGSNGEYDLHNLYSYFQCELKIIINKGLSEIPWYYKNFWSWFLVFVGIAFYLLSDYVI